MRDLAVLIPTRGRPDNILKVIAAWDFTNAWDHADMVLVVDADDPEYPSYAALVDEHRHPDTDIPLFSLFVVPQWVPMVHKLNQAARDLARAYLAVGFAGDDHLPRTINWAERYLTVLREMGSGMVYGDDGYQGAKLSTEWAVTSDTVLALGRMVPADVEHMYCDNAMMDLFGGAKALRHLPEVRIEHMHPIVGKGETDAQYQRVNHRDQFAKDRRAYEAWRGTVLHADQLDKIRDLRKGRPDVTPEKHIADRTRRIVGSGPRPAMAQRARREVQRSGPTSSRGPRVPRHFKNVRAATPEDVMMALADLASQVPAGLEIVELGVFQGRTALQLAWGAEQGNGNHVTAIDPWELEGNVYDPPFTDRGSRIQAFHNVESLGYADKIRLVQGFSHDEAEVWPYVGEDSKVGLLYVDGDHTEEGARRDIVAWAPHLAPGAVIAVDDYGHPDWPGVGRAVDTLVAEGFLAPIDLYHDRLAVTRLAFKLPDDAAETLTPITAITSEGVSPSPYPAAGQVAVPYQVTESSVLQPLPVERTWAPGDSPVLPEVDPGSYAPDAVDLLFDGPDTEVPTDPAVDRHREVVNAGELDGITNGTPIEELTIPDLKALAKHRGIVLGARKDKRDLILQALRDGK
jgi:predicted O-methyltransferase YrrM